MNNTRIQINFINQTKTYTSLADTQPGLPTTSRLSYQSVYSQSDSVSSSRVKRLNQLAPKPKISIKEQKGAEHKKIERQESEKSSFRRMLLKFGADKQKNMQSIDYSSIRPILGLQKFVNLCGIQRGSSSNGCSCIPCKWKKLWTQNYSPKNQKLYADLKQNKPDQKNTEQIRKDIYRTYPECPTFNRNDQFVNKLRQILTIYSIYDPQAGYAQGMNMIAAVLLYHIKDTQKTFWAFVDLMDDQELRMIYFGEFQSLKNHCAKLKDIISRKVKDLYLHMEELGVIPDVFFYGWFLSLMSNCIPLQYMHLVVQKFREKGWKFIYKLIVTYLVFIKQKLLLSQDSSQFLMSIANDSCKQIGMHWQQMIQNCHKVEL